MAMANKTKKPSRAKKGHETSSQPSYPYCTVPKSLRRFLEMVPQKPKPPKVTTSTLQLWGLKSGNDASILRVLKTLELLGPNGETTSPYAEFMRKDSGPAALGTKIRATYAKLFENVTKPENASNEELINFFNIHSGGSEATIRLQVDPDLSP